MKKKLFKSIGLAVLLLTLLVSNVFAFSLGTTDGVWGRIDVTDLGFAEGATCEHYGAVTSPSYELIDAMGVAYNTSVGPGGESERFIRNANVCTGNTVDDHAFATNNPAGWTRDTPNNGRWNGFRNHTNTCGNTETLIISRYVYHSRNNDDDRLAIEIYNNTGDEVDLKDYSLLLFTGDQEYDVIPLTGTPANAPNMLASPGYYVVGTDETSGQITLDDTFVNRDTYRTVALVKNYIPGTVDRVVGGGSVEDVFNDSFIDENQARYGNFSNGCGEANADNFVRQSGFGFQGMPANPTFQPAEGEYFPVGRFCHYNNPVYVPNGGNSFNTINLNLSVNDIACPTGQTIEPATGDNTLDRTFKFVATLNETTNYNSVNQQYECPYGDDTTNPTSGWPSYGGSRTYTGGTGTGLNRNGCADMVSFSSAVGNLSFICRYDASHTQEYHLSIVGFTPTTVGGVCPTVPVGELQYNQVYTAEQSNNCYCMYASYTKNQITPVTLANFGANWTENGVLLDWVTVTETNNFGFNIMRAEIVDGERIQINPEMIISGLAPGDPFGSSYEYLDETAVPGTEYFYWLVDVPLDSSEPGVYGPISPAP